MISLTHPPSRLERRSGRASRARSVTGVGLRLRQSGEGWVLVTPDDELVFQAPGIDGRRRCLEFARARGVLALFA
jgi:hypothetical protein